MIKYITKTIHITTNDDFAIRILIHPFSIRIGIYSNVIITLKSRILWYPASTQFLLNSKYRMQYLNKVFGVFLKEQGTMQMIMGSCQTYGDYLAKHAATTIQRYWRAWHTRKVYSIHKMRVHAELGLLPPGAFHESFPGGFTFLSCQDRFYTGY